MRNNEMKKKIVIVAGARPNFMKIGPLMHEFIRHKNIFNTILIHTGQHYDFEMSEKFLKDLNIPKPDYFLNVGSASHATQTAKIMVAFEKVILNVMPDLVVVVGDVNSTLACAIVASKLNIKIAHVEAGLRSFDRTMPEEINRIVTDSLSDYLFVSEESGLMNLKAEGVNSKKVYFVGNIMIDTLLSKMNIIAKCNILNSLSMRDKTNKLKLKTYAVLTLHRPANVDSNESLTKIYNILKTISQKTKIVYPIHPRTKKMIKKHNFLKKFELLNNLIMVKPLGYIDFIKLAKDSRFVLTDSGGIQEETTFLKVPCLTMRDNTERPVTIKKGTNYLVGRNKSRVVRHVDYILNNSNKRSQIPKLWDGKTAERIVRIIINSCNTEERRK
ncbi:MAG: UDP-N-acetylglucosamine 2-epimerase [Candidatus Scalindua rubra]|uniref:UDP-N-acetylglucosamine 2-epimerase n=1 Tax=Candidatus Scalindua rubra TaxID=1872076 RepID=A0A1E3X9F4_9BACT|nr:MAG: UDP-N-acetylglucosamine 2-epimerase [Candidatus Scalindua rubra]